MAWREIFTMWRDVRMIAFTALGAAVYVAVLLPFKGLVLIPGLTEVRPGAAIPIVLSFLFGPAAAWGAAFGNTLADVLGGTLTAGTFFGFFGNFLYGYLPYSLWRAVMGQKNPVRSGARGWAVYFVVVLTSCLAIGSVVGWGLDILGLAPFAALGLIIAVNNFIAAAVIATILLLLLYHRAEGRGLLYHQILEDEPGGFSGKKLSRYGVLACLVGAALAFASGMVISGEVLGAGYGAAALSGAAKGAGSVLFGLTPGLTLLILGALLL
ncbi:MAG: QueT transporter family protein [Pseudomonadota bacterium]